MPEGINPGEMAQTAAYAEQLAAAMRSIEEAARSVSQSFAKSAETQATLTASGEKMATSMQALTGLLGTAQNIEEKITATVEDAVYATMEMANLHKELIVSGQELNLLSQHLAENWRDIEKRTAQMQDKSQSWGTRLKAAMAESGQAFAHDHPEFTSALRTANTGLGVGAGLIALKDTIAPMLGFGGLIGLMVEGKSVETQFAAAGQQISQVFLQTSDHAEHFAGKMAGAARSLQAMFGHEMTKELMASAQGLATGGITDKEANLEGGPILAALGLGRKSLVTGAFTLDNLFHMAAGTIGKLTGLIHKDFGGAAKDAMSTLQRFGEAARLTGQNVGEFFGQIMQAASSLKTYHVAIEDVADAQMNLTRAMSNGPHDPNMAFKGQLAATQTQGMLQGIAGMGVGLSAVIGERVGQEIGKPVSGLAAWFEMQRGFRGDHADQTMPLGAIVHQMQNLAHQVAPGDKAAQTFFLEKQGYSFEGALGILNTQLGKGDQLTVEQMRDLKQATMTADQRAAQQTDEMVKMREQLRLAIAEMGSGLIKVMVGGFHALLDGIMMLLHKNWITGKTDEAYDLYAKDLSGTTATMSSGMKMMANSARKNIGTSKEFAGMFGFDKDWFHEGMGKSTDSSEVKSMDANPDEFKSIRGYLQSPGHSGMVNQLGHGYVDTAADRIMRKIAENPAMQHQFDEAITKAHGQVDAQTVKTIINATYTIETSPPQRGKNKTQARDTQQP